MRYVYLVGRPTHACTRPLGSYDMLSDFGFLEHTSLGCFRNSAYTEFRMFFLIPHIPYSIRNCPKFRGITRNSVLKNLLNSAEFCGIPWLLVSRNSALLYSYIFFHCKNCFMPFFLQFFWFYFIKKSKSLCRWIFFSWLSQGVFQNF